MSSDPRVLSTTLAAWVHQIHLAGIAPSHEDAAAYLTRIDAATSSEEGESAALGLVEAIAAAVEGDSPEQVATWARAWYGGRARTDLGAAETREERLHGVRAYQFAHSVPWLARIWERADGQVAPSWLVIERVTDEVFAMDPNPWNDIDEDRRLPLTDFMVLWELDGATSICLD
jgi:hypothetical protein